MIQFLIFQLPEREKKKYIKHKKKQNIKCTLKQTHKKHVNYRCSQVFENQCTATSHPDHIASSSWQAYITMFNGVCIYCSPHRIHAPSTAQARQCLQDKCLSHSWAWQGSHGERCRLCHLHTSQITKFFPWNNYIIPA